jgi:predicted lysophospholipase L1 biosynthesis ABC-type transport system permease subunit
MTYDVVFHDDVRQFLRNEDFKKFVADTALDGVNRVLAEHKEKVSPDYKIMKHVNCKGERPQLMTVKNKDAANPLIGNMDLSKAESKLQKDIMKQRQDAID